MDVIIQQCNGVPEGSMLSVRAGQTRRQAPFEVGRPLRFRTEDFLKGDVSATSEIQVDIMQFVGRGKIELSPATNRYTFQLESSKLNCELEVRWPEQRGALPAEAPVKQQPAQAKPPQSAVLPNSVHGSGARRHEEALSARRYMDAHQLVQAVQTAMTVTVSNRPDDPLIYMAQQLLQAAEDLKGFDKQGLKGADEAVCADEGEISVEDAVDEPSKMDVSAEEGTVVDHVQEVPSVSFSMSVKNVDYNVITADASLLKDFKRGVKEAIAAKAGDGILPEHVEVKLSSGSVIVHATIVPPCSVEVNAVKSTLVAASSSVRESVLAKVEEVPRISLAAKGTIRVESLSPPTVTKAEVRQVVAKRVDVGSKPLPQQEPIALAAEKPPTPPTPPVNSGRPPSTVSLTATELAALAPVPQETPAAPSTVSMEELAVGATAPLEEPAAHFAASLEEPIALAAEKPPTPPTPPVNSARPPSTVSLTATELAALAPVPQETPAAPSTVSMEELAVGATAPLEEPAAHFAASVEEPPAPACLQQPPGQPKLAMSWSGSSISVAENGSIIGEADNEARARSIAELHLGTLLQPPHVETDREALNSAEPPVQAWASAQGCWTAVAMPEGATQEWPEASAVLVGACVDSSLIGKLPEQAPLSIDTTVMQPTSAASVATPTTEALGTPNTDMQDAASEFADLEEIQRSAGEKELDDLEHAKGKARDALLIGLEKDFFSDAVPDAFEESSAIQEVDDLGPVMRNTRRVLEKYADQEVDDLGLVMRNARRVLEKYADQEDPMVKPSGVQTDLNVDGTLVAKLQEQALPTIGEAPSTLPDTTAGNSTLQELTSVAVADGEDAVSSSFVGTSGESSGMQVQPVDEFDMLDRNKDGVITREKYNMSECQTTANKSDEKTSKALVVPVAEKAHVEIQAKLRNFFVNAMATGELEAAVHEVVRSLPDGQQDAAPPQACPAPPSPAERDPSETSEGVSSITIDQQPEDEENRKMSKCHQAFAHQTLTDIIRNLQDPAVQALPSGKPPSINSSKSSSVLSASGCSSVVTHLQLIEEDNIHLQPAYKAEASKALEQILRKSELLRNAQARKDSKDSKETSEKVREQIHAKFVALSESGDLQRVVAEALAREAISFQQEPNSEPKANSSGVQSALTSVRSVGSRDIISCGQASSTVVSETAEEEKVRLEIRAGLEAYFSQGQLEQIMERILAQCLETPAPVPVVAAEGIAA